MRRLTLHQPEPLFDVHATRQLEQAALITSPGQPLMARAGLAVAQLARAIAPHARCIWVACGPGNNGGDGLIAATHLHRQTSARSGAPRVVITHCGNPSQRPTAAAWALTQAREAGVLFSDTMPPECDLVIDALLGIGRLRPPQGKMAEMLQILQRTSTPVLCVDTPSGLDANTGCHLLGPRSEAFTGTRQTLSLLTLKPGLFTADGRDQAGTVWFDDLGVVQPAAAAPCATLHATTPPDRFTDRSHAHHKGAGGDVLIIGGQGIVRDGTGMTGAAILAARAALHAGAGRVYLSLLEEPATRSVTGWDPVSPELMFRSTAALRAGQWPPHAAVVCGCGGGHALAPLLPEALARAQQLVLDADALNLLAVDLVLEQVVRERSHAGRTTVLTPHPLEAARLLGCDTATVMNDRLQAARQLSERFGAICVLKGSGTVTCSASATPLINASGNALLATAGTGDVLAGMIGAALAAPGQGRSALLRVADAVWQHGWMADEWQRKKVLTGTTSTLTADGLARRLSPT
ncbi:MAG: NAD(P)H-hydrate dehydratase [Hydrogenophaga sp.]